MPTTQLGTALKPTGMGDNWIAYWCLKFWWWIPMHTAISNRNERQLDHLLVPGFWLRISTPANPIWDGTKSNKNAQLDHLLIPAILAGNFANHNPTWNRSNSNRNGQLDYLLISKILTGWVFQYPQSYLVWF